MRLAEGTYVLEKASGIAKGFSVHAEETKKAMRKCGTIFDNTSNVVLHIAPAFGVQPIEGKTNILYTAYEAKDLPPSYQKPASKMDMIIGTSKFVTGVFKNHFPEKVCKTCSLGVDLSVFKYKKRKPGKSFVYLWVGAPSKRKGWELIKQAWYVFEKDTSVALLVKTTGRNKLEVAGNVIVNSLDISKKQLAEIYYLANCFIFPSYAEGFGLTLAEAMATGLPCIYTPWAGVNDFASRRNAYPLEYDVVEVDYGVKSTGAKAKVVDLVEKMRMVKDNYGTAKIKGKRAHKTMQEFSWAKTGKQMTEIIGRFLNERPSRSC